MDGGCQKDDVWLRIGTAPAIASKLRPKVGRGTAHHRWPQHGAMSPSASNYVYGRKHITHGTAWGTCQLMSAVFKLTQSLFSTFFIIFQHLSTAWIESSNAFWLLRRTAGFHDALRSSIKSQMAATHPVFEK